MNEIKKFEDLANQMLFNIWLQKPDSSILGFVKKYVPVLAQVSKEWTVQRVMLHAESEIKTIHSVLFSLHPFFPLNFKEGRIDILTREISGNVVGIRDIQLWLFFESEKNAKRTFEEIKEIFKNSSTFIKDRMHGESLISVLEDEKSESWINAVQLYLIKDPLQESNSKILFRIGDNHINGL
jgi:hypothetical protein